MKNGLKAAGKFLGVVGLTALGLAAAYKIIDQTNGEIISSGKKRKYLLYVPRSYDPTRPAPLVIMLHGFSEWPANARDYTRWNALAEQAGFLVVYPSGQGIIKRWNLAIHEQDGTGVKQESRFISDLVDKLQGEYHIDPQRIYAAGFSNGAGMAVALACRQSDRFAAIGGVSGAYLYPAQACRPSRPIPSMFFHGVDDPVVPYAGGSSFSFHYPFPNIPRWVEQWAERNGCQDTPVDLPAQGQVQGIRYPGCQHGADVVFYTIQNGGHSWPGGKPLPVVFVGHTTQDIDATRVLWTFFQEHPLG